MTSPQEMVLVSPTHPALHQVSKDVHKGTDCTFLFTALYDKLHRHQGVGIAAPQIGILKRIIIIAADTAGNPIGLINPVITRRYGSRVRGIEECLSYPGVQKSMTRYKRVNIEGYTHDWQLVRLKLRGLAAKIAQHEIDHLNGITIVGGRV